MTTPDIIQKINKIVITSSDDDQSLNRIHELMVELRGNQDGYLACESLIMLLEKHPNIEFGTPGEPVHTLESYVGYYEQLLFASLNRIPTYMTVWMLNRIINGIRDLNKRQKLVDKLKNCSVHNKASDWAKQSAIDFYNFQTK